MINAIGPFILFDEPHTAIYIEYTEHGLTGFYFNDKTEKTPYPLQQEFYAYDLTTQKKVWFLIVQNTVYRQALLPNGILLPRLECYAPNITPANYHLNTHQKQIIATTLNAKTIPIIKELYLNHRDFNLAYPDLLNKAEFQYLRAEIAELFASSNTYNHNLMRYWLARAVITGESLIHLPLDATSMLKLEEKCRNFRTCYLSPHNSALPGYIQALIQSIFVKIITDLSGYLPDFYQFKSDFYLLIKQKISAWMQHSSLKNSTLLQCIHHSQDGTKLLADIKQLAKQRQHRNCSKFNGLWFRGRDSKIVQPLYNHIVKNAATLSFNQDFFEFLQSLETSTINEAPVSVTQAQEFLKKLVLDLKPMVTNSRGLKELIKYIESQSEINVEATLHTMHTIAVNRQHRCWSKLSIFGKGRDTELVQPLYDLMAQSNFKLTPYFIAKINEIIFMRQLSSTLKANQY